MPGLSFIHAGILAGLAAVSIPVLIHLLNRLRFREVEWAAMEFLLEVNRRTRRRLRIEHLLLLLARMLVVAFLVLAVSRPLLRGASFLPIPGAGTRTEWVLLLDDSASMGHRTGDARAFDRARDAARTLVQRIAAEHPGDVVTLCRGSRPALPDAAALGVAGPRAARVLDLLQRLPLTDTALDLPGAAAALARRIRETREGRAVTLVLFSDFCRRDLGEGDDARQRTRDALAELARAADRIVLVDAGDPNRENTGVIALESEDRNLVAGVRASFTARVRNFGSRPLLDARLAFSAGDVTLPPLLVPPAGPGETVAVSIPFTFAEPGSYPVQVVLTHDALPADDRRILAAEVHEAVRVLVVDGERGLNDDEAETFFLARALAPPGHVASGVAVDVIPDHLLLDQDLSPYHAAFLCNLYRVPPERIAALERFVSDGGGIVFFLGDQVDPGSFNRDLFAGGGGLAPVRIVGSRGVEGEGASVTFASASPGHPLTRGFEEEGGAGPRISRFCTVEPADLEAEGVSVILRFTDADASPAALERAFGRGHVVLFTTACDLEWGRWPTDFHFLLTVQELVRTLPGAKSLRWNRIVGETLTRPLDASRFEAGVLLRTPGYPEEPEKTVMAAPAPGGEGLLLEVRDTTRAGFTTLLLRGRDGETRSEIHAANLDPGEGDLAPADRRDLDAVFQGAPYVKVTAGEGFGTGAEGQGRELWRFFVLALLALLMVEGFLALRFGHHQSGPS